MKFIKEEIVLRFLKDQITTVFMRFIKNHAFMILNLIISINGREPECHIYDTYER